jgi:hypothetical protein
MAASSGFFILMDTDATAENTGISTTQLGKWEQMQQKNMDM